MVDCLTQVNALLNQPNTFSRNSEHIICLVSLFLDSYEHLDAAAYGDNSYSDELRPLLATIGDPTAIIPFDVDIVLAKMMKVLLRKGPNRASLGKNGMTSIIKSIQRIQAKSADNIIAAAEMCNAMLNSCYDGANVKVLIEQDGVRPILRFLKYDDTAVIAGALGVLQGVCYVPVGRQYVRQDGKVLKKLVQFLTSEETLVRARSVGVIHNLSVDGVAISLIVESGCTPLLVSLLRDSSAEICRSAAGTIQNLSRDAHARQLIVDAGVVEHISDLLFASDVPCQVAAVGTMLNIVGSSLVDPADRLLLQEVLTDGLVLGAIRSCVFDSSRGR